MYEPFLHQKASRADWKTAKKTKPAKIMGLRLRQDEK